MRILLCSALVLATGCSFPLSDATSATVLWERSHEGTVTAMAVLRADGECPTLSASAIGTLNGVPLTFDNGRADIIGGCRAAAAFKTVVDESFASESGDGTWVLSDGETELRLVVANLFDSRGLRVLGDSTIRPGEELGLRWLPENERQTFGYGGLLRDDSVISSVAGAPAEAGSLAVPSELSPGPITLLTQGGSELSFTECPAGLACVGTASTLGETFSLSVVP